MLPFVKGLFGSYFEFFTFEWLVLLEYKNFEKESALAYTELSGVGFCLYSVFAKLIW
jgi:hypothetical protein